MLLGDKDNDVESAMAIENVTGFPMMFLPSSFFPLEMMPGFLIAMNLGDTLIAPDGDCLSAVSF